MPVPSENHFRALKFWMYRDLQIWFINAQISFPETSRVFNYTVNCCNFERFRSRNFFAKIWLESVTTDADGLKFVCPFKKGFSELKERDFSNLVKGIQYIPSFVLSQKVFIVRVSFTYLTRVKGQMVNFFDVQESYKVHVFDE